MSTDFLPFGLDAPPGLGLGQRIVFYRKFSILAASEGARDDVRGVPREARDGLDPIKHFAGFGSPRFFQPTPGSEGRQEPRGNLWVVDVGSSGSLVIDSVQRAGSCGPPFSGLESPRAAAFHLPFPHPALLEPRLHQNRKPRNQKRIDLFHVLQHMVLQVLTQTGSE